MHTAFLILFPGCSTPETNGGFPRIKPVETSKGTLYFFDNFKNNLRLLGEYRKKSDAEEIQKILRANKIESKIEKVKVADIYVGNMILPAVEYLVFGRLPDKNISPQAKPEWVVFYSSENFDANSEFMKISLILIQNGIDIKTGMRELNRLYVYPRKDLPVYDEAVNILKKHGKSRGFLEPRMLYLKNTEYKFRDKIRKLKRQVWDSYLPPPQDKK